MLDCLLSRRVHHFCAGADASAADASKQKPPPQSPSAGKDVLFAGAFYAAAAAAAGRSPWRLGDSHGGLGCVRTGWLYKPGSRGMHWKRRYCTLTPARLAYFEDKDDVDDDAEMARGHVELAAANLLAGPGELRWPRVMPRGPPSSARARVITHRERWSASHAVLISPIDEGPHVPLLRRGMGAHAAAALLGVRARPTVSGAQSADDLAKWNASLLVALGGAYSSDGAS